MGRELEQAEPLNPSKTFSTRKGLLLIYTEATEAMSLNQKSFDLRTKPNTAYSAKKVLTGVHVKVTGLMKMITSGSCSAFYNKIYIQKVIFTSRDNIERHLER